MLRLIALLAVIGIAVLAAVIVGIPNAAQLKSQFTGMGPGAPLVFAAIYAAATLSPLPKSVFTVAAGAVFGLAEGLLVVLAGAIVGAVVAFYLARALGRDGVHRLTGISTDRFDDPLARRGFLTVFVARLIPVVPFTVVNYLAGLTTLRVQVFLAATAVGILPATTAYITIGTAGSRPSSWPFWVAVLALVTLTGFGGAGRWWRRRCRTAPWTLKVREIRISERPSDDGPTPVQP